MNEKTCEIILHNVPKELRMAIKMQALREGKTMQGLIIELMARHIKGGITRESK